MIHSGRTTRRTATRATPACAAEPLPDDGWNPVGVPFPNLSAEDRKTGHIYLTGLPATIVAHVDYVRVVRILPLAPEQRDEHRIPVPARDPR
jgi:Rieske 2Fe-2S family protein